MRSFRSDRQYAPKRDSQQPRPDSTSEKLRTVCGEVATGRYAERTRGRPTFLNLDKPYPDQVFTILIWGESRAKFGTPEQSLLHKRVCVSGSIREYGGKPEIVASEPSQIERQE